MGERDNGDQAEDTEQAACANGLTQGQMIAHPAVFFLGTGLLLNHGPGKCRSFEDRL